jgi:hypothetical protein
MDTRRSHREAVQRSTSAATRRQLRRWPAATCVGASGAASSPPVPSRPVSAAAGPVPRHDQPRPGQGLACRLPAGIAGLAETARQRGSGRGGSLAVESDRTQSQSHSASVIATSQGFPQEFREGSAPIGISYWTDHCGSQTDEMICPDQPESTAQRWSPVALSGSDTARRAAANSSLRRTPSFR